MEGAAAEFAQFMLTKANTANYLKVRVNVDNLGGRLAILNKLNYKHVLDSHVLTLDYLRNMTIRVYQLNLSYIQDALAR